MTYFTDLTEYLVQNKLDQIYESDKPLQNQGVKMRPRRK